MLKEGSPETIVESRQIILVQHWSDELTRSNTTN